MVDTDAQPTVSFFKKGKSRPTTSRRRSVSPTPGGASSSTADTSTAKSQVVLPSKKQGGNLLSAGTKRSTSQRDDLDASEDTRDGPDVKWTAAGSHQNAAQEILDGDEAEEILAKRRRTEKAGDDDALVPDDGLYRGQKAYKSHLQKSKEIPKSMRVGPQRGSSTIKTVTIVDYQPDVCKDYKETGYCGFGDTCKFLHDRGTYLAGWQLDKLAADPKKSANAADSDSDSDSDEDLPFACLICRKPYTDPVVTRCGHYYCSACAIKRFAKTPKCLACGAPTGGIFNRADKLLEKIKKKQGNDVDGDAGEDKEGPRSGLELEGLENASDDDSDGD